MTDDDDNESALSDDDDDSDSDNWTLRAEITKQQSPVNVVGHAAVGRVDDDVVVVIVVVFRIVVVLMHLAFDHAPHAEMVHERC